MSPDLESLYAAYSEALLVFIARRTADPQIALDIWAETFAVAFQRRATFRGSTSAEAGGWLFGIARNQLASYHRRGRIEQRAVDRLKLERPSVSPAVLEDLERRAGLDELRGQLTDAMAELSPALRAAVELRVVDELEYRVVAARLGVSEGTARVRVSRGLAALAEFFDQQPTQERSMSTDPRQLSDGEPLKDYLEDFGRRYGSAIEVAACESPVPLGSQRRPWRLRLGAPIAIGALAASGFLVIAIFPSADGLNVAQAASAALGSGDTLVHYRVRSEVEVQDSRRAAEECSFGGITEVWQTTTKPLRYRARIPARPKHCDREIRTVGGKRISGPQEWSIDGSTFATYVPDLKRVTVVKNVSEQRPPVSLPGMPSEAVDPVTALRDALNEGRLRESRRMNGRIELTGHTRETTRGGRRPSGLIIHHDLRYVVDASSFRPIRLSSTDRTYFFKGNGRPRDGSFTSKASVTFVSYETQTLDAKSERLLSIHPAASATTMTSTAK